eukprot:scaffold9105_cov112-Isochrysis_galbana.AAC.2
MLDRLRQPRGAQLAAVLICVRLCSAVTVTGARRGVAPSPSLDPPVPIPVPVPLPLSLGAGRGVAHDHRAEGGADDPDRRDGGGF